MSIAKPQQERQMPFKAVCNGEFVRSPDFDARTWRDEKARHKRGAVEYTCPVCKERLTLATSSTGTPFFKHYRDSKCPVEWGGVSPEHRDLQVAIYRACKAAGWETDIEVRSPSGAWIADVLAWRGKEKWAFEVQLAPITGETLEARANRYRRSHVKSVWFVSKWPALCPYPVHDHTYKVPVLRNEQIRTVPDWVSPDSLGDIMDRLYRTSDRRLVEPEHLAYWSRRKAILQHIGQVTPENITRNIHHITAMVPAVLSGDLPGEMERESRGYYEKAAAFQNASRAAWGMAWKIVAAEQRRLHNIQVRTRAKFDRARSDDNIAAEAAMRRLAKELDLARAACPELRRRASL